MKNFFTSLPFHNSSYFLTLWHTFCFLHFLVILVHCKETLHVTSALVEMLTITIFLANFEAKKDILH